MFLLVMTVTFFLIHLFFTTVHNTIKKRAIRYKRRICHRLQGHRRTMKSFVHLTQQQTISPLNYMYECS